MTDEKNPVGRPAKEVKLSKKQEVRCLESEKDNWKEAAKISGVTASEFMRQAANKESTKVLKNQ